MESRTPCIYKFFNSLSGSTAVPEHKTAAGRHLELFMPRERLCISYSFDICKRTFIFKKNGSPHYTWIKKSGLSMHSTMAFVYCALLLIHFYCDEMCI